MSSLKKLAVRGATWTLLGYGLAQILRLGSNLVLTRLLVPELFGLMALIYTFVTGLNLFSDVGIRPSIVQNQRGDEPNFYNTAWTLQVARGFGLWFGCFAIAWPVAQIYDDSRLLWLLPAIGMTTAITGFNSTALFTLNRRIDLGKLTIFELGIQVISLVVTITWAWLSPTIWALVAGALISSSLKALISHWLIPGTGNRLTWDRKAANELFSFGKWIFVSTATTFLASQADRLILGKLISFQLLGIYTVAFTLADLPRAVLERVTNGVMFPLISRHADLPRKILRAKIFQKRRFLVIGIAFLVAILVSFGDFIIVILYDERYRQAAWMLPILSLGLWPNLLSVSIDRSLFAIGKPIFVASGSFLKFVYMLIGLPLGYAQGGILGAVLVVAFNDIPFYGAVVFGLWREQLICVRQDIWATGLLAGLITLFLIGRYLLGFGLPINEIL